MSENKLYGVWFKLFLDKPATRLGNWFGEVRTYDNNTQFLIYNSKFILEPNEPLVVNFFVDYHRNETAPPKLINFRLNGREMCPESLAVPAPVPPRKLFTNPPASEEATTIAGGIVQSREPLIEATNVQLEGKKSKDDDLWNVLLRVVSVERVRRQS
ncbi:uncharacterized protein LOC132699637 [Cylas formicarius]|uniref:uncharacterized protein LOC132699637 n=1 Tax=Cylas formicarius TaxID=197179 RepID=UPI0029587561|nr:uncharacterized protein LOC132699637 [Cylas formicarius]XP_060522453.1 uncharacterized protein LOC132699637 [Cylas formicarius]XP_060522454.1 uncharacterized protein LOC132699637 [Cylas formicarius]